MCYCKHNTTHSGAQAISFFDQGVESAGDHGGYSCASRTDRYLVGDRVSAGIS